MLAPYLPCCRCLFPSVCNCLAVCAENMAAAHVVQFEPHSVRSEEFLTTYGHVQQPPASPVKDLLKTAVVSFFATTLVLGLVSVLRTPSTRLYAPAQATRVANPAITRGAFVVKAEVCCSCQPQFSHVLTFQLGQRS